MNVIESSDVTKEKSLSALYLLSYSFPPDRFNRSISGFIFLLLGCYCYLLWDSPHVLLVLFRRLVEIGLTFSTSILGFLIAGFTIFITVTKIQLFAKMARMPYEGSDISFFKYISSAFVFAFVHYVSYLFFCIFCEIFLMPQGLVSATYFVIQSNQCLTTYAPIIKKISASMLVTVFGIWSLYLVLLLKSFIFNIYAVVTIVVRWHMEGES